MHTQCHLAIVSASDLEKRSVCSNMSSVGDGDQVSRAIQPSERPPASPQDMGWDLPAGYKVKRCKFCKCWSTDLCPWPLKNSLLSAWEPLMPWQRGSVKKPVSDECKMCWNVS